MIMLLDDVKPINITKCLNKHYGGKWKYRAGSWWSDDNRHVAHVSICDCDDDCGCPGAYFMYSDHEPTKRIYL